RLGVDQQHAVLRRRDGSSRLENLSCGAWRPAQRVPGRGDRHGSQGQPDDHAASAQVRGEQGCDEDDDATHGDDEGDGPRDAAATLKPDGGDVAWFAANAGDEAAPAAATAATIERFGAVDILVNNAGTNPYMGPTLGISVSQMDKTHAVNQRAIVLWTAEAW